MSALDTELAAGESQALDRPWYNELVGKLKDLSAANHITVRPSTTRAVVHPSPEENHALTPGLVSVEDQTNWGDTPAGDLQVEWEIVSGPGHVTKTPGGAPSASVSTGPNETVYWGWSNSSDSSFDSSYYSSRPERDWSGVVDGASLPGVVHIRATAKKQLPDSTYSTVSQTTTHVVVERGYDPSVQPGISPNVHPQQDVAYLGSDGTSSVIFDDLTTATGESNVTRTVTAYMQGGSGTNVTVSGNYLDGAANIIGVADEDLTVTATAQAAGTLIIEIEYDTGSEVTRITRAVVVRPALETQLGATTDPSLPPVQLEKGDGFFTLEAGQPVAIQSLTDEGSVFGESPGMQWTNERSSELAKRLGVESMGQEDVQLDMLYEAGAILVAALHQPTENGLRKYAISLPEQAAQAGQIIKVDDGVLRLKEHTERADGTDQFTAVGVVEDTSVGTGTVTGNGEVFEISVHLAYGQASRSSFPEVMHRRTITLHPGAEAGAVTLPSESPDEIGDRWYVRYQVTSRWTNGKTVRGSWTDWQEADRLPEGAARASLDAEDKSSVLNVDAPGRVQGVTKWAQQGSSPISDEEVLRSDFLPTTTDTHPAPGLWKSVSKPPRLFVKLLQVSPAGSSRGQVESFAFDLPAEARQVLPTMSVTGNSIPTGTPVVPGMLIEGTSQAWIGLTDRYLSLGSGAGISSLLEGIAVRVDNDSFAPATKDSATRYTRGVQAFAADFITVELETVGVVDKVEYMSGRQSFLQPRTNPTKQQGGQFQQAFVIPQNASGAENTLRYRIVAGDDERIIEVVIENTSVTTDTGPEVLGIDTMLVDSSGQLATAKGSQPIIDTKVNTDTLPQEWTLTAEDSQHTWEGTELIITAEDMRDAELVRAGNSSGFDFGLDDIKLRVDSRSKPAKAYVNLGDPNFDNEAEPELELKLSTTRDPGGDTKNILIKLRYSGPTPIQAV